MKLSQTNGPLFPYYHDSITETLAHLRRAGFRYVDVSFFNRFVRGSRYWGDPQPIIDEYLRAFDALGMMPVQCHEPAGNSLGDDGGEYYMRKTPAAMKIAAAIGVPSMVVHPGDSPVPMTHDQMIEANVRALRRLMPVAEQYNMKILLENMVEFAPDTADDLIAIVDEVNHPLLGINWDVGHGNVCGLDQYTEIKKIGSRLWGLHLHDNVGWASPDHAGKYTPNYDYHLPPFYGNLNYDAVMTALIEVGYKGTFNFEADGPQPRPGKLPFAPNGKPIEKLARMSPALREQADALLYNIGKYILQTYDCFEE